MGLVRYLLALLLMLIPATLLADTHTAASCSRADVLVKVNDAATGDVVSIPTGSCTWDSGITITGKNITIQGAGPTSTVLTAGTSGTLFDLGTTSSRLTNMGFTTGAGTGVAVKISGVDWRVDHIRFNNERVAGRVFVGVIKGPDTVATKGLIDNNTIINGKCTFFDYSVSGYFARASARWAGSISMGDENAIYMEDNYIERNDGRPGTIINDANHGQRYVIRYNTIVGTNNTEVQNTLGHGVQAGYYRGARSAEIYGNEWNSPVSKFAAMFVRSGTAMIFANKITGKFSQTIRLDTERITYSTTSDNTTLAGACDGNNAGDMNDGGTGYTGWPCRDQIGRSTDASVLTTAGYPGWAITNAGDQASMPAYVFINRKNDALENATVSTGQELYIAADRDYFQSTTGTGDGSTGVGCGTLANRPATCSKEGVAYWATDQSCEAVTDLVGAKSQHADRSTITGTLYKCNAEGSWDSYYTPYTYPHPLRDDAAGDETAPTLVSATINAAGTSLTLVFSEAVTVNTNTGFVLTATGSPSLTYASGTGTATLVYTISAAVQQSESGITLAYTTGANYIEDAAGNDLVSFSGTAVVNNSTQNTPPTVELTVTKTGSGCTITSTPSGVNCGSTCTVSVDSGTVVTLSGWSENGWNAITYGGDCASNGTVTMSAAKECTATCTQVYLFP